MATRNEITGDLIQTKLGKDNDAYADGWERIFGKKKKETHEILRQDTKWEGPPIDLAAPETTTNKPVEPAVLCDICGKELNKVNECAWTSCPLNWNESRTDIIGQNGNVGYE